MAAPTALIFDLLARDGASPVFNRVAASADRAAVATERAGAASVGFSKKVKAAFAGLAIGAIGVEVVKSAVQFQRSMLLIQTQAGASAGEVKKMSSALLGLAGTVATAPDELAKSMYHIESAGYRGAKALQIQTIAAEGAKVGNADLVETTNALTSAVVAGIKGAQNMQQAMGALNATVGAGDMSLSDLNQALGTGILATAKSFGVTLQEVGATLAVFGDNNIRGADAATKFRMVIQDLAKPAAHADVALKQIGLTVDRLRSSLAEKGYTATLDLLHRKLLAAGYSGARMGSLLEDAFTKKAGAGLAILMQQMTRYGQKMPQIHRQATDFGAAWKATTKTASFAFDKIKAQVEAFGISLGTKLLPYVTEAAQWLGKSLPRAFATIGAILAPMAREVGGVLAGAWHLLAKTLGVVGGALSSVGKFLAAHTQIVTVAAHAVEGMLAVWAGYRVLVLAADAVAVLSAAFRNGFAGIGRYATSTRAAFMGTSAQAAVTTRIMQAEFAQIEASALEAAAVQKKAAAQNIQAMAEEVAASKTASAERIANIRAVAAAMQVEADEAVAAAATSSAAAREAAAATAVAGSEAKVAWAGVLGPIGLAVGALSLVGLGFLGAGKDAKIGSENVQTFTDAIERDNNALGKNTRAAVVNALAKDGALKQARTLGISLSELTDTVLHGGDAYDTLRTSLTRTIHEHTKYTTEVSRAGAVQSTTYDAVARAAKGLLSTIGGESGGLKTAMQDARDHAAAMRQVGAGYDGSANAAEHYAAVQSKVKIALHNSTDATHAFRDALAGVMGLLNRASIAIAFQQSLNDLAQTFRDNKGAIVGHSNAALADKAAFVDLGKQIVTQAQAMRKHGASVKTVTGYLRTHVGALREAARAGGADAGQVRKLVRMLGLVPGRIHTYIDVETQTAIQRVQALADAYKTLGQDAMSASTVTSMALKSSGASMSAHTTTSGGRGGIGDLLGTNGPTNPNASDSAAAARFPTTVPTNSAAAKAASKAKEKAKKAEAARKAALAKARQQAAAARSAAESTASGLISGIGQTASAQFQVGDIGINRVERQINAARAKIAALGHLRPADRARFAAQIESLVKLAQRQLDKLKVRIRTHDLAAFRKSLTGTAAEVRASFTAMLDDLRKAGASGGVLDRLRTREARLTAAVRRRNRDQARLDRLTASAKDLRNSVKSAVTGSFDVTQAGTNPISNRVTGGSLLAQETQELNRIRKWGKDIKKLNHRGLNHEYLRQLASAGPSSLPQVEALLSLGDAAFTRFNRQEQQIQQAGTRIGRSVGGDIYGGRTGAARAAVREDRRRVHELAHAMTLALREELPHLSIKLDGRELNAAHHDHERRNRRHGGRS